MTRTTAEEAQEIGPKRAPEVSLVLPVHNEAESLAELDREMRAVLADLGRSAEIIYVDDGSSDASPEVLRDLVRAAAPGDIRTRVATFRRNYGQTAALAAGFDLAAGEVVIPLDADGQNNPADIPRLLAKLEEGFDVVSGWRRERHDLLITRRIPSWVANKLISKVAGPALHDYGCTLKAYRASILKEIRLYGDMHRFIPVFMAAAGARVTELEVDHRPRTAGQSKYGGRRVLAVLVDLVLVTFMSRFYSRPMHFFGNVALIFLTAAALLGLLMLTFKFGWLGIFGIAYTASFVETPLAVLAATCFVGTVTSLFFGILAEVLIRIHHESTGFTAYGVRRLEDSHGDSE